MSNRNAALCGAERDDGAPCTLEIGHVPPHSYAGTLLHGSRWSHKHCDQRFTLQGVIYACEREQDHGGDHVYAFTAGQLQAVLYQLQEHSRPAFPSEAVLLAFGALGIAVFAQQRSATDWAVSLYMCAVAVRWLRIWTVERKGSRS